MSSLLRVTIARIPFEIQVDDPRLGARLERFFSTYLSRQKPFFRIVIQGTSRELKMDSAQNYPVVIVPDGCLLNIVERRENGKTRALGHINPAKKNCSFILKDLKHFSNVISAIRVSFLFFLELQGGFFLHASSGKVKGRTYIFTGKADVGKTTALKNLKPDEVVAEDALAVRTDGKKPCIYAIPFRKDKNAQGPAAAIFFPRKAVGAPRIEKESPATCVSELMANAMYASPHSQELMEPVMESIVKFSRHVPGFSLYFPRRGSIREVIVHGTDGF